MSDKQLQLAFLQYLYKVSGAKTEEEFLQFIQLIGREGIQKYQQQFMAALQQLQAQKAAHGAKLDYITRLNNGNCAADEEPAYFKIGGKFCRKCKKKQEEGGAIPYTPILEPQSVVEKFKSAKCGAKMKKKKCEDGGEVDMAKCGKKVKKGQEGLELLGRAAGRMGGLFINPVFHGALAGGIPEEMKVPKTRYRDTGVNQSLDYPSGGTYMQRLLNRMSPDTIYYKDDMEYTREDPNYRSIANLFDRALMRASAGYPDQRSLNYEKNRVKKQVSKHDLGGDIGNPAKTPKKWNGLAFARSQLNFPRGHAIISELILIPDGRRSDGEYYYPDFGRNPGRNIYVSPHGNDTVYYNYPDSYIGIDGGFMSIGNTKNQNLAKSKFLLLTRKSLPYTDSSREAWKRARREK